MTTQEMLASLEAQIRKDIPRLMELREGCYLMNHTTEKVYKIINVDGGICFLVDINNYKLSLLEITKSTAENYFKIIGHEIMLNDVLEWLFYTITKKAVIVFDVDVFGVRAFYPQRDSDRYIDATKRIKIDFFTPYLKDQSEELIKFLYDLKQEIYENE